MPKIDLHLKRAVLDLMIGGKDISYCYQCGRCNDDCPVSQRWGTRYNPKDLVLFSALGYKEALFAAVIRDPFVLWGCTGCETCDEVCPSKIPITDIICLLKNAACGAGAAPGYYFDSVQGIMDNGMAIPVQVAIEKRKEKLGLAASPKIPTEEVKTIMQATGIDKIVQNAKASKV